MSGPAPLLVVGDALLDRDVEGVVERMAPDAPVPVVDERMVRTRPGGAGLAAVLAAAGGRDVTLVTALCDDAAGAELRAALEGAGVEVIDLGQTGATPEKVRVRAGDRPLLRLDRGGDGEAVGGLTAAARAAVGWADAVLVADYGLGVAAEAGVRETIEAIAGGVPVVWDPHPRGPHPVPGLALLTPNAAEAEHFTPEISAAGAGALPARAAALARRWAAGHVCVTRGARGALLVNEAGAAAEFPAAPVAGGDPCGAGDRFASRAAELLADRAPVPDAVAGAVAAATAFVAAGGASSVGRVAASAAPRFAGADAGADAGAADVVARVRAEGGTIVATGGCFDLLHTGHVRTLQAARALGDCLVVLLNADASVRRLKGPGRPVVGEDDRAAVLRALRCVDAVLIFDEDTPTAALERLRPDVWVKGGDYALEDLPEAAALERWNGRTVLLPHLGGRSTTKLIEEAAARVV